MLNVFSKAGGYTPTRTGMKKALDVLNSRPPSKDKTIILLTDGEPWVHPQVYDKNSEDVCFGSKIDQELVDKKIADVNVIIIGNKKFISFSKLV